MAEIGKRNSLKIIRDASPGIYLDGGELGEILLPNRYVPKQFRPGDQLEVFVYRDSEDRLVATTQMPVATVGDIAALRVIGVNPRVGAFLDWGLEKDLLLPFREQTRNVKAGQEVTVRVYLDEKSQRIVASMKLAKASPAGGTQTFLAGQQVEFILTEETPLGYKALVEDATPGLLFHEAITAPVQLGQKLKGFVRAVRPDGKLDLSLQQSGYKRVAPLAQRIVRALEKNRGQLDLDDNSSPDVIRAEFGVSKKAFKQALGALFKARRIRFLNPGIELLDNSSWSPGEGRGAKLR